MVFQNRRGWDDSQFPAPVPQCSVCASSIAEQYILSSLTMVKYFSFPNLQKVVRNRRQVAFLLSVVFHFYEITQMKLQLLLVQGAGKSWVGEKLQIRSLACACLFALEGCLLQEIITAPLQRSAEMAGNGPMSKVRASGAVSQGSYLCLEKVWKTN